MERSRWYRKPIVASVALALGLSACSGGGTEDATPEQAPSVATETTEYSGRPFPEFVEEYYVAEEDLTLRLQDHEVIQFAFGMCMFWKEHTFGGEPIDWVHVTNPAYYKTQKDHLHIDPELLYPVPARDTSKLYLAGGVNLWGTPDWDYEKAELNLDYRFGPNPETSRSEVIHSVRSEFTIVSSSSSVETKQVRVESDDEGGWFTSEGIQVMHLRYLPLTYTHKELEELCKNNQETL